MKLVKFSNGKFGVRACWFFGWHFYDLISPHITWHRSDSGFVYCQGSKEDAERIIRMKTSTDYEVIS